MLSGGGVFNTPPIISQNKAIFGPKNHETILSHERGAHLIYFGVFDPPLAPQKTYFYEKAQNMLKFGNFQKSRFLGVQRGFFGFEPSKMSLYMIIYYLWRIGGRKMPLFKNFCILKMSFLIFLGALGGPPVKRFCQKWFQRVSHT